MIITVTMNPCIDKHITLDKLEQGATCKALSEQAVVAGKGINVARVLKAMGRQVLCLGLARENDKNLFLDTLADAMLAEDFAFAKGDLRVNLKLHTNDGVTTEINSAGSAVSSTIIEAVAEKIQSSSEQSELVILSGSLPNGANADFYAELIKKLKSLGVECALDASGEALLKAVKSSPAIIKPNIDELCQLCGKNISDVDSVCKTAMDIANEYGIKYVIVSLGKEGSVIADNKSAYIAQAPNVNVVSTTGAGDAMLAGVAVAYTRGLDIEAILKMGVAASGGMISKNPEDELDFKQVRMLLPTIQITKYE